MTETREDYVGRSKEVDSIRDCLGLFSDAIRRLAVRGNSATGQHRSRALRHVGEAITELEQLSDMLRDYASEATGEGE